MKRKGKDNGDKNGQNIKYNSIIAKVKSDADNKTKEKDNKQVEVEQSSRSS